jgi:hypothetical protein
MRWQPRTRNRRRASLNSSSQHPASIFSLPQQYTTSACDAWRLSNTTSLTPGAPAFHFLNQMVSGQKQGIGMIYGAIQQQSAMLAFNDIYRMLAAIAVVLIPSFILFRGTKSTPLGAAAH